MMDYSKNDALKTLVFLIEETRNLLRMQKLIDNGKQLLIELDNKEQLFWKR